MSSITKNVSFRLKFPMYDSTTGLHKTGITPAVTISKDGGAFAATTNAAAEIGATGVYAVVLTSTEMNADVIAAKATGTGALATTSVVTTDTVIASTADAVWDETLTTSNHYTLTSAGRKLFDLAGRVHNSGTAQAGSAQTITLATSAPTTNHLYEGDLLYIIEGTGAGQSRVIIDYDTGRIATVHRNWDVNPDNTSVYVVIAADDVQTIEEGKTAAGSGATSIVFEGDASATDDVYIGMTVVVLQTSVKQARIITDYVGATKTATVHRAWESTPGTGWPYMILPVGQVRVAQLENNVITDAATAADMDTYQAKVWMTDDDSGTTDRYVVAFFKNSQPFRTGGGITSPTIQVVKASDGSDLIAATAMTEIGTSEIYKYDATGAERIADGAGYAVIITATIDGSSREWVEVLNSRDS